MTDYPKQRVDPGFTLIELLVVVAIIALLTVLLAPSIRNVFHSSRAATCGGNLRRIGEAIALFSGSDRSGRKVALTPGSWPTDLANYVDDTGVFVCPEAETASQAAQRPILSDLVCVNIPNTGLDLEFIEGPFSVKLSDEQFQAANFVENRAITLPAYSPGADPTVYWWVFEDAPFGRWVIDYEVAVRVAENGDGTLTLTCQRVTGGSYSSDLIDKTDNRRVLVSRAQMNGGPDSEVVLGYGGGASYGMNAEFNSISDDVDKIVAMDYPWFVARSVHDWASDSFAGEVPGIPVFARHMGKLNVLFTGGSVHLKRPDDVNPNFHQATLWDE